MQTTIHLLSEETINQIAAGEVVEDPTSAVKELVENSLDAKASQITIEISAGGFQLIRISDNGIGMNEADALISIKRHATSKILNARDLFRLNTMGFRGEALAAISAVSKFTMITTIADGLATKIEVEAGELKSVENQARAKGTTIEVRSLFFNVPARKKFQKKANSSSAAIYRTLIVLALGHPEVSFKLISNGKLSIDVPSQDLKSRAKELLGNDFLQKCTHLQSSNPGSFDPVEIRDLGAIGVLGFLGFPTEARVNRSGQYLFINKRAVECPLISSTIKEAYGSRLAEARFPTFLIHLSIPCDLIDVNIHPQKKEIKLRDERFFRDKIHEIISLTLQNDEALPSSGPIKESAPWTSLFAESQSEFLSKDLQALKFQETSATEEWTLNLPKTFQPIGMFGQYLLLEGSSIKDQYDGIVFLDLNAACSQLLFEQLCHRESALEKQGLLLPFTLEFSSLDSAMLLSNLDAIEALGFSLRPIGKNVFIVEAIPPFMEEGSSKQAIKTFASELQIFIGKSDIEKQREKHLAKVALRFAKIKKIFHLQEAVSLLEKLLSSSSPYICPQGKPTMIHFTAHEIESLFS